MSKVRRLARMSGILACSALALLLWSKLKLVSGIPRTAYAVPEAQPPERVPADAAAVPAPLPPPPAPTKR